MKNTNKIIQYFKGKSEIEAVYLYGSQAKRNATANSDIDLALLINAKKDSKGFNIPEVRYNFDLEKLLKSKIDILDLTSATIDFAYRIISEGKILVGKNSKKRVLFEEKIMQDFFDMKPAIDEYYKSLREIAGKGELHVRYT